MISKVEKIVLLSIASIGAALYLYGIFAAFAEPDSHARAVLPQVLIETMMLAGFIYLIGKGAIKKRIFVWISFVALIGLLALFNYIYETLYSASHPYGP